MSLLSTTVPSTRGVQGSTAGSSAYVSQAAPAAGVTPTSYDGASDRAATRGEAFDSNTFNDNLGAAYAAGSLANSATQTGLQLQYNLGLADLNNYGQQYYNDVGQANDTYNNSVTSNNLNTLSNLAQQAAVPRDIAYTDNSYANQVGRYNDQTAYVGAQQGYNNTDLSQSDQYLGQSGGLADQLQQIQNQGAGITQSDADRSARYATEASGAGATARAYGDNLGSATATYNNALAGNANTNASTHNSLNYQIGQAQLTHDKTASDLTDQQSSLNHGIWQSGLDTTEKDAQSNDTLGQLKLSAAQLGVNATQLQDSLNHTLTSLNLQNQITAGQILTDLGSNNAQRQQTALQVFYQAVANAQAAGK